MNVQPYCRPPRWWPPKLSPPWIRFWRRFRLRDQFVKHRLVEVQAHGLEPADPARRQFEEDILDLKTASIRGERKATVSFGQPISVAAGKGARTTPTELTRLLEEQVQGLLDESAEEVGQTFGAITNSVSR